MTKITFELDGKPVEGEPGETIWQVAQRHGTKIPHLCWHPAPGYRADGNCRACMVEVEGERVLAASCQRKATAGMKVKSASERAKKSRAMVFELLLADQPERETSHDQVELLELGRRHGRHAHPADIRAITARPRTARIRRSPSTSTPASAAGCACAPAARCRPTT